MRILVIGPCYPGALALSYARAFERNGHEVFCFDSDRAYFQAAWYAGVPWARRLLRRILWNRMNLTTIEVVRCVRPGLILAFKAPYLEPETIRRIRTESSAPVANYYPDDPYIGVPLDPRKASAQRRNLIQALQEYTRVFIWERGMASRLERDGVSASYLPFGVDADLFKPMAAATCQVCRRDHAVVFVGQHNTDREQQVNEIRRHEVALWGARWSRAERRFQGRHVIHQQRVFGEDCAAVYSAAKACLNIVNRWNIPGHNMRTFEIPASGGIMLSTYTAEQAEFFPEAEAAWYYRAPVELDGLIERLLSDQEAQTRTKTAALKIAQDHTYDKRARELLNALFGMRT